MTANARTEDGPVTGLRVIGTGFGRTGTLSLKQALDDLGFGPTYHMEEVLKRPSHIKVWRDLARTGQADWDDLFVGFGSGVDFPVSCVWRELADRYPDAKLVHTVRDPQRWWESTESTIFRTSDMFPPWLPPLLPPAAGYLEVVDRLVWSGLFDGRFLDRGHAIEVFERHTAEVVASVPSDRLLVLDVAEGWGPLCAFLGVPEPAHPFPHLNDAASMRRRITVTRVGTRALPIAAGVALATVAGRSRRRRRSLPTPVSRRGGGR